MNSSCTIENFPSFVNIVLLQIGVTYNIIKNHLRFSYGYREIFKTGGNMLPGLLSYHLVCHQDCKPVTMNYLTMVDPSKWKFERS